VGTGYFSTDVHIKSVSAQGRSPFNYQLPEKEILEVPIAHGEGRFITKTPALEHALWEHQQILFQYCSADGAVLDEYPINPNGSMHNIAAVCNPKGNVMAIMPHPERGITAPGKIIFESVFNWLKDKRHLKTFFDAPDTLSVPLVAIKPEPLSTPNKTLDLYIKLIITDNEEYTIQKTLERLDTVRDISLSKYKFCRIHFKKTINETQLKTILKSGLVANTQKERVTVRNKTSWSEVSKNYKITPAENLYESAPGIIIEYREDSLGDSLTGKLSTLLPRCGIVRVETGVMWQFHGTKKPTKKELESLYTHRLFWNPNSQACYVIPN
jgi:phosphoribosylformylglycinamidine synthase